MQETLTQVAKVSATVFTDVDARRLAFQLLAIGLAWGLWGAGVWNCHAI